MKIITIIISLLFLVASIAFTQADSIKNRNEKFSIIVHSGKPEKIIDNNAEVSFGVNMFGRAELAFKGIVGIQLEPTSAYRHKSITNVGKGDNLYLKLNDSTFYLLHISNLWANDIEVEFSFIPNLIAPSENGQLIGQGISMSEPLPIERQNRLTLYGIGIFPLGQFQEVDFSRPTSGFAEFGIGGGAGFIHQMSEHTEIGGAFLYTHNSLNESKLMYEILGKYPSAEVNIKAWDLIWIMGEGGFTGKILPFIDYYIRGSIGIMTGYAPDVSAIAGNTSENYLVGSTTTIGYGAAMGFRESEKIDLGIRFLNATGTFAKRDQSSDHNIFQFQILVGLIF